MPKILIVDDDPAIARMTRLILQHDGHQVVNAANGQEGLSQYEAERPDLIVLDLQMPVMDGRTFFKTIEATVGRPPVIILSAYGAQLAQEELGAEGCISKPFHPDDLSQAISRLLTP